MPQNMDTKAYTEARNVYFIIFIGSFSHTLTTQQLGIYAMDRKTETLYHLAHGLNIDQTAERMDITRSCVEKHLAEAKKRLGAKTVANAVYIAVKRGILVSALVGVLYGTTDLVGRGGGVRNMRPDAFTLDSQNPIV